jgi:hypothetical protein
VALHLPAAQALDEQLRHLAAALQSATSPVVGALAKATAACFNGWHPFGVPFAHENAVTSPPPLRRIGSRNSAAAEGTDETE